MERVNIKIIDIISILVFHICCISIYYGHFFFKIQMLFAIISCIYLIRRIKVLTLNKYKKFNLVFFSFLFVSVLSCVINGNDLTNSLWFFFKLVILLMFTELVHEQKREKTVIRQYGTLYLIYVLLSIFIDSTHHELFGLYDKNYLIGNKFSVSYAAFMSVIFVDSFRKNFDLKGLKLKAYYFLLLLFSIFVCYSTDCNTGIICCVLYFILNSLNKEKLKSGKSALSIAIISSMLLLFFRNYILDLPVIKHLVVDVLNRNLTLSGRTRIYDSMFQIIFKKPLLGYGYNNSYSILYPLIQAPNTQNALVEWWFNSGVIGLGLLLYTIYICFENMKKNKNNIINIDSFAIGMYVFLILGSIEITIGTAFFVLLLFSNVGYFREEVIINDK